MDILSLLAGGVLAQGAASALTLLREHRPEPAGLADLLLWSYLVDDGVVLGKDGSFLAGWCYRGPDLAAATVADVERLSEHVNSALLPFGDGWMLHVNAVRRPAPGYAPPGAFPDPVTALIDEERWESYETNSHRFETDSYLVLTHLPPPDLYSRVARLFVEGAGAGPSSWGTLLDDFRRHADELERRLSSELKIERLGSGDLLTHLHSCLTGLLHPVRPPGSGSDLDVLLADQDLIGGFRPRVGQLSLRVLTIHGFPEAARFGMLDRLANLSYALRLSHRILPLSQQSAQKLLRRIQVNWFKKRRGAIDWISSMASDSKRSSRTAEDQLFLDHDASRMAADAGEAVAENASGAVRFCFYTATLLLFEPSEQLADQAAAETLKTIQDLGFPARIETINAVEAWLSSLPGHGYPNIRRAVLHTRNLTDLLPLTSVWPGLRHNPSPYFPPGSPPLLWAATTGSTPFRVNLHASDVGHTLIVGPTGSGKSTLVNLLVASWFRYPKAQAFVFDIGYSGYLLAAAAGAKHYAIASGTTDSICFQPLADIDRTSELAAAAEWLELLLALQGTTVTPAARTALTEALRLVAGSGREHRTLTQLFIQLQHPELTESLRPYTVQGNLGTLLDADRDDLEAHPYQVFELSHLFDLGERALLPVLTYLFHRIEQRLDGRPTLIVVEEAWLPLVHTAFAQKIRSWLLTLRKRNAAVVLVTQSLAQLQASEHQQVLFDSCPTRIFLPNASALLPANAQLYGSLGLNEAELRLLAAAAPKRDYYLTSPHGSRLFELGLGPVALAFFGAAEGMTFQETLLAAQSLQAEAGDSWPYRWLEDRGLFEWADRFQQLRRRAHEG